MPTDWSTEDREQIRKARAAAEALFQPRPKAEILQPGPAPTSASVAHPQPAREPRILSIPVAGTAADEPPAQAMRPTPEARRTATRPRGREIPVAQYARIRTLVAYGMTEEQVAALEERPVAEIERIIKG